MSATNDLLDKKDEQIARLQRELTQAKERLDRYDRRSESGESLGDLFDAIERAESAERQLSLTKEMHRIDKEAFHLCDAKATELSAKMAVITKSAWAVLKSPLFCSEVFVELEETLTNLPEQSQKLLAVVEAAEKLKFSAYPAHGSGFVIIVSEGNVNALEKAVRALRGGKE